MLLLLAHHKNCQQVAIPLHDCPNGDIYTASREDCIDISTGICASLWNVGIKYDYGDKIA